MEKPKLLARDGKLVFITEVADALREDRCMCLHCGRMKVGDPDHCKIAADFYKICQKHGNAFILTRCQRWIVKEG